MNNYCMQYKFSSQKQHCYNTILEIDNGSMREKK